MVIRHVKSGKSGQAKLQQTAFLLIALTIFFVLVGLFALSFSLSGVKEKKASLEEEKAMLLVSSLAKTPEFFCESAFGAKTSSCVDFDKVLVLKKHANDYKDFWKVNNIEIIRLSSNLSVECTEFNYPNCGVLRIFSGNSTGTDKSTFISLCRKETYHGTFYNKCEVAKLVVRF